MSGLRLDRRCRAASVFGLPTSLEPNVTWRCKLVTSTTSKSTRPSRPTPAAARYKPSGAPRPPVLKNSKVLLIGTGGLGAPLGLYLAAAGVGRLGLVDFDVVDFTNLQRQVTFGISDVGKPKSEAARVRLSNLNPDIQIESFETQLTSANALDLFKDFDIIVDGTDNFPTRYLVNDACILLGKPNVYGSIFRFEGQATVFGMPDGPCYRCLYPEPP